MPSPKADYSYSLLAQSLDLVVLAANLIAGGQQQAGIVGGQYLDVGAQFLVVRTDALVFRLGGFQALGQFGDLFGVLFVIGSIRMQITSRRWSNNLRRKHIVCIQW